MIDYIDKGLKYVIILTLVMLLLSGIIIGIVTLLKMIN